MATTTQPLEVRAQLRYARFSAYKAREVLDLVRGKPVAEARSILQFTERGSSEPILKVLESAIANAGHNNDIPPDELYVATAYADEGPTLRRFRPRARGRGTRIRKRTCHVTIVLSRLSATELERQRSKDAGRRVAPADARASRARRVAQSRKSGETDVAPTEDAFEGATEIDGDSGAGEITEAEAVTDEIIEDSSAEVAEDAAVDSVEDGDTEVATDEGAFAGATEIEDEGAESGDTESSDTESKDA